MFVFILVALPTIIAMAFFSGPISQDPAYHAFADSRPILGVRNFWNIVSNLPFLVIGGLGIRTAFQMRAEPTFPAWLTFFVGILLTALVMTSTILFLPVEQIAKLASAFMILAFMFVCGTVIVLREIASSWYEPRFRSPLYPLMQILGVVSGIALLAAMGPTSLYAIGCIVVAGAISYFGYGQRKTSRRGVVGALLHAPVASLERR